MGWGCCSGRAGVEVLDDDKDLRIIYQKLCDSAGTLDMRPGNWGYAQFSGVVC